MQKVAVFINYQGQTQLYLESYNSELYTLEEYTLYRMRVSKNVTCIVPYDYGYLGL